MEEQRKKVRRIYGQNKEQYDNLFFGLIKTKAEKEKEKQYKSQRNANIQLTTNQSIKVAAEANAANFNAQAAKAKAIAAERLAETANLQLKGAQSTVQLKNIAVAFGLLMVTGIIVGTVYLLRENRKAAQLQVNKMKIKNSSMSSHQQ